MTEAFWDKCRQIAKHKSKHITIVEQPIYHQYRTQGVYKTTKLAHKPQYKT